jgi:hypothetical protein
MLPVGVPPPGAFALTVNENVTDWPYTEVLGDEVTAVVVPSRLTVWGRLAVLVMKLALPLYVAVIVAWPIASLAVLNEAEPPLRVAVPSVVVPFINVTEPAGVPFPGKFALTVAVNVTAWP